MSHVLSHPVPRARPRVFLAVLAGLSFAAMGSATAQSLSADSPPAVSEGAPSRTQWGLGVAGGVFQRPYAGAGNKNRLLPLLYVENDWVRLLGTGLDLKLGHWQPGYGSLAVTGVLKYEGLGYKDSDSAALAGMDKRSGGFWAGGALSWKTPLANASLEWTADVSDHSKGQQLQLQVDRRFGWGRLGLTPRLQANWLDGKAVDYAYGVKAAEALPNRAQYTGASAVTVGAGLRVDYLLQPRQSVFLDLGVTRLPGEITDSPIVDRSSVSRLGLGYLYRF